MYKYLTCRNCKSDMSPTLMQMAIYHNKTVNVYTVHCPKCNSEDVYVLDRVENITEKSE